MTRAELVRELRDLRRLERRVRGIPSGGSTETWNRFFATADGARVRYPLATMLAFDRSSRRRAIDEFLVALWAAGGGRVESSADRRLLDLLGLDSGAGSADVRGAFRRLALELHPDVGGDHELMRDLIERYRQSSYGDGGR